jgi:hypothetical protein
LAALRCEQQLAATLSNQLTNFVSIEHPLIPVHLLVFGIQAFITSLTCLVEVWAWEDRSVAEKQNITALYGPYVALGMSNKLIAVSLDGVC